MTTVKSISELQLAIKAELEKNTYFVTHGVGIIIENAKDIEYQIKSAMGSLGTVITVSTPSLTYSGNLAGPVTDEKSPFWTLNSIQIVTVENPTMNRGRANYSTALDTALQIAETIHQIPTMCNMSITQTTMNGLVVVTVTVKSTAVFALAKREL